MKRITSRSGRIGDIASTARMGNNRSRCVSSAALSSRWICISNRLLNVFTRVAFLWSFSVCSSVQVIDEDTLRNKRPESMSVSVHGVQALFVKPAQSLAPILGMAFLPHGALKTDLMDMTLAQVCAENPTCPCFQVLRNLRSEFARRSRGVR